MEKFFILVDKYKKVLMLFLGLFFILALSFPITRYYTIWDDHPKLIKSSFFGYQFYGVSSWIKAFANGESYYIRAVVQDCFFMFFTLLACVSYIFSLIRTFRAKSSLAVISLSCLMLAGLTGSFYYFPDIPARISDFYAVPMLWGSATILICHTFYLLLRRFYAPAKARILAYKDRKPPSKDERIAELERKVAELEKAKHDKPQE